MLLSAYGHCKGDLRSLAYTFIHSQDRIIFDEVVRMTVTMIADSR
jgi:hypothetical protein